MGLLALIFSGNFVNLPSPSQPGAGLMETEKNAVFDTLHVGIEHPAIIADSFIWSGFSPAGDAADLSAVFLKIGADIDLLQHWFMDNGFIRQRQFKIDRQTLIRHVLILAGTADLDVRVTCAPVYWKRIKDSFWPFRDHVEITVRTFPHDLPGFREPFIGICNEVQLML